MHVVHVATETPVGELPAAWRATVLPWGHVLLGNVNFCVVFPLDCLATQETDKAGCTRLQLCAHQGIQCLTVRGQI